MYILKSSLTHILTPLGFSPSCLLCQQKLMHCDRICQDCKASLPWVTSSCRQCARPLAVAHAQCGHCQQQPPAFDRAVVALDYVFPVDRLIVGGKFSQRLTYLTLLGELFSDYWQQQHHPRPDVLIPVPLHAQRLRERGYNQALEIARVVGNKLSIPVDFSLAKRIKPTLAQAGLAASARRGNVEKAFACSASLAQVNIALVDDVLTTGSTVNALSKTLRNAGAANIDIYCIARSLEMK